VVVEEEEGVEGRRKGREEREDGEGATGDE